MRPTGNTSFKKNLSLRERRHYKARVRASRDAEGRVKLSSPLASPLSQCPTTTTTGPWQCPVYNALGQRVEDDQSDGQGRPMQLYYPRDIFGDRTGIWDDHSIAGWVGWDIYWSKVAGQRLNMGGSSAYIDHADAVGSTAMETDPAAGGIKLPVQNSVARRFSIANHQSQITNHSIAQSPKAADAARRSF